MLKIKTLIGLASARTHAIVRAAAVEVLEDRKMFSTSDLGALPLGYKQGFEPNRNEASYTFTLKTAAVVSAFAPSGSATLWRGSKMIGSGKYIERPLSAAGTYTIKAHDAALAGVTIATGKTASPTRLEASVWGGNAIRLNWDDNADNAVQYRVDRWTRLGWRKSVRVDGDATAAVIDNLTPGSAVTYRVSAVTAEGESVRSVNTISAVTAAEDETAWYRVKSLGGAQKGEADWKMNKDGLFIYPSRWVRASDWRVAVDKTIRTALYPVEIGVTSDAGGHKVGDVVKHEFPKGGDFQVGTAGELRKLAPAGRVSGIPASLAAETKLIVLEDSYNAIDRDYDDFYWILNIEKIEGLGKELQIKRTIEDDSVYAEASDGGGSLGRGDEFDIKWEVTPSKLPADAVVRWQVFFDGSTGAGTKIKRVLDSSHLIQFWLDLDNDGMNIGEPTAEHMFRTVEYKVHKIQVAQASTVTPMDNGLVDANLKEASDALNIRHSSTDRRAAVRFVRDGSILTWIVDDNKPDYMDPLDMGMELLRRNVGADIHIVREYFDPDIVGRTAVGLANSVTVRYGATASTWVHELGHSYGIGGHSENPKGVMYHNSALGRNELDDNERAKFE